MDARIFRASGLFQMSAKGWWWALPMDVRSQLGQQTKTSLPFSPPPISIQVKGREQNRQDPSIGRLSGMPGSEEDAILFAAITRALWRDR